MLIDLEQFRDGGSVEADVCVAGAGPAGIAMARSLVDAGHRVCLLEAGGRDFEARTQALYAGASVGMEYYELDHARLRMFGGTLGIWGGRSALLDHIDFERRPWVEGSGWPIARDELLPWYRRAHDLLELGAFDYEGAGLDRDLRAVWRSDDGRELDPDAVAVRTWRFDTCQERFGWAAAADLVDAPRCTVVLHANVTALRATDNGDGVRSVSIAALNGVKAKVRARFFVLACGAIENARVLLDSTDVEPGGVGNRHDQVGRHFMEHPHGRIGRLHVRDPYRLWRVTQKRYLADGVPVAPALVMGEAMQRRCEALNSAVTLKLQRDPGRGVPINKKLYLRLKHDFNPTRAGRGAHHVYRAARDWLQRHARDPLYRWRARTGRAELHLIVRAEQVPNPSSRVRLGDQRDALGGRRAVLDWRLSDQDKLGARLLAETFDQELRRLALGHVELPDWLHDPDPAWPVDPTVSNHPIGGYHHIGTTRMSSDPRRGVVDADCRVHGCDNLYIAGSSVFSTAGWANPTLSLLALALRCADHLDGRLRGGMPLVGSPSTQGERRG